MSEQVLALCSVHSLLQRRLGAHELSSVEVALVTVPSGGHSIEISSVVDVQTPKFTRLIPSPIRRVCSENEQESKRRRQNRERGQGKADLGNSRQNRIVHYTREVLISARQKVPRPNKGRNSACGKDLIPDILVDPRAKQCFQVLPESIRRPMLDPIIMRVPVPSRDQAWMRILVTNVANMAVILTQSSGTCAILHQTFQLLGLLRSGGPLLIGIQGQVR